MSSTHVHHSNVGQNNQNELYVIFQCCNLIGQPAVPVEFKHKETEKKIRHCVVLNYISVHDTGSLRTKVNTKLTSLYHVGVLI